MNKDRDFDSGDIILIVCLFVCIIAFIVMVFYSASLEERIDELTAQHAPVTEHEELEMEYLRSQIRYYDMLSIDYEASLEGRGLLEVTE